MFLLFFKHFFFLVVCVHFNVFSLLFYSENNTVKQPSDCFYRGGLYNWFEGGRESEFFTATPKLQIPRIGDSCTEDGQYCAKNPELDFWYPCSQKSETIDNKTVYYGCYFGRGPLQVFQQKKKSKIFKKALIFFF